MTAAATPTEFRSMPIGELRVSATLSQIERRAHLDKGAIAELAESIAAVGMLQPLVVRPVNGHFEIVAGERRFLAAKQAKLAHIPVNVLQLTDEQVLEVQLVENLQREDIHELAEAEGYEGLMKLGYTAETIAEKVGTSKGTVYARMKMLALVPAARSAFYAGKINSSIALVVARLNPEHQPEALEWALSRSRYDDRMVSFRVFADYVQREFMTRLSEAPFPRDDALIVPAAGPCTTCPKRSGNQSELFADVKSADICTDLLCFRAKSNAWNKQQRMKARESGVRVLSGAESRQIASPYSTSLQGGFVRPTDLVPDDAKKRTYAKLLGTVPDKAAAMLQHPKSGKYSKVIDLSKLPADVVKKAGIKVEKQTANREPTRNDTARRAAEDAKRKQNEAFELHLLAAVVAATPVKLGRDELTTIVMSLVGYGYGDGKELEACGLPPGKGSIEPRLKQLSEAQLARFVFGISFIEDIGGYNAEPSKALLAAATRMGIDVKKLRTEFIAAEKEKAPTKAKSAKKARR